MKTISVRNRLPRSESNRNRILVLPGQTRVVIVFDSNIWISELGLRSGAAAAVKFFLRQQGARLAIPEVVRLEVKYHLQRDLREYIEEIRSNYRQLLTAFGKLKELVLPPNRMLRQR